MNDREMISVVIPVYNGAKYLKRAVDSALGQGKLVKEILIIDDASTDYISDVMEEYKRCSNVIYIKHKRNKGVAAARNKGVAAASGEYIAFLDADDWWSAGKLEAQMELMKKTKSVLSYTGRSIYRDEKKWFDCTVPGVLTYEDVMKCNFIACSSVVLLRSVAQEMPMSSEKGIHEDYLNWICILKKYQTICGIPNSFLNYTYHRDSRSGSKIKSFTRRIKTYRMSGLQKRRAIYLACRYYFGWIVQVKRERK